MNATFSRDWVVLVLFMLRRSSNAGVVSEVFRTIVVAKAVMELVVSTARYLSCA